LGCGRRAALCVLGLALTLVPGITLALPANHGRATSAPLFVQDLPVGTISVRLSRPSMTEAIVGTEVVGTWTTPEGKRASRVAPTGADGRALFAGVPVGSRFQANAEVEGESLVSAEFAVPGEGGTRLLMIVGAKDDETTDETTGDAPATEDAHKPVGLRAGTVKAESGLPAGVLDLRVLEADGKAVAGIKVSVGHLQEANMEFVTADTDGSGQAHFANLRTGQATAYAAVIERDGLRLGTDIFTLDDKRGAAGEIRIPARTGDLSVLRISSDSRMMLELREDSISLLQNFIVENRSDKVFDPGPAGLLIPLPDEFAGAEKLHGGAEVEIKEGLGVLLRALLPPTTSAAAAAQVRVGYLLPTHGQRDFEIVQPMPLGIQGGSVLVPAEFRVELSAPGLRTRPPERDEAGNNLRTFDLDAVAPGHALRLTVRGLPTHDRSGRWIAGVLVGLLILAGIVATARPRGRNSVADKAG
jgi:hypothetical protein